MSIGDYIEAAAKEHDPVIHEIAIAKEIIQDDLARCPRCGRLGCACLRPVS